MTAALRGRIIGPGDSTQASIRRGPPAGVVVPATQQQQAMVLPPAPQKRRDFFVYPITFTGLAAGAADQGSIQIQADSDFELSKLTFFADIAAADQDESTRVLPLITVQITDSGTGRSMFSQPLPVPAIMGDGRIPFILPTPKIFSANASVQVAVQSFSAATDYNIRIALIGAKIFAYG